WRNITIGFPDRKVLPFPTNGCAATVTKLRCCRRTVRCTYRKGAAMPEKRTIERAQKEKRAGRAPGTQAGEFVREEIHKIRRGEHGARSAKQAIAIGLSEARRAGVDLPPPEKGKVSER